MDPVPLDCGERERWKERPIFRRRGSDKAWDKSSYAKTWWNVIVEVSKDAPELAGMWLRDLRSVAKTVMIDAAVPSEVTKTILGHKPSVADGYYRLTDSAMREALEALTLDAEEPAAVLAAGQGGSVRSMRFKDVEKSS